MTPVPYPKPSHGSVIPKIHPITEAMMLRIQLHAILEKHGITDERKRAECGLEILSWITEIFSEKEFDAR